MSMASTEEISPQYRILPIISGVVVPFSILLAIPSLTGHWYVQTGEKGVVVDSKPNSFLLMLAMAVSLACAVLAIGCLVMRFSERWVKPMTILCVIFLSVHDIINIIAVSLFAVRHRVDDGFTYGPPFWMTVCSTATGSITNITLIIDYVSTPKFATSGSGLTGKQRNLVIIIIILFVYLAIGALIQSYLLDLTFINSLYFSVVSIETVGFGDIYPTTTASRIFVVFYVTFGILNLAVALVCVRETLLEAIVIHLQHRIHAIRDRERKRRAHSKWRKAVKWRLRAQRLPVWIDLPRDATPTYLGFLGLLRSWKLKAESPNFSAGRSLTVVRRLRPRRLNIEALTRSQLEAAALEAGAPLSELLPPGFVPFDSDADTWRPLPTPAAISGPSPLTHIRIGGMANLLTSFAFAVAHGEHSVFEGNNGDGDGDGEDADEDGDGDGDSATVGGRSLGVSMSRASTLDGPTLAKMMENEEKLAFHIHLVSAVLFFLLFWLVGAGMFSRTEGWSFGIAFYFCYTAFTTLGYGDLAPQTPAGRSIFVAWALVGIGTVAFLLAIMSDAYSVRYKQAIHTAINEKSISDDDPSEQASVATLPRTQSLPRSATIMSSSSTPPASASTGEQRLRSVTFAETPVALHEKSNEIIPVDNSQFSQAMPSDFGAVTAGGSGSLQDALGRQIQAFRGLLQDAEKENGNLPVIRSLQSIVETLERESRRL